MRDLRRVASAVWDPISSFIKERARPAGWSSIRGDGSECACEALKPTCVEATQKEHASHMREHQECTDLVWGRIYVLLIRFLDARSPSVTLSPQYTRDGSAPHFRPRPHGQGGPRRLRLLLRGSLVLWPWARVSTCYFMASYWQNMPIASHCPLHHFGGQSGAVRVAVPCGQRHRN